MEFARTGFECAMAYADDRRDPCLSMVWMVNWESYCFALFWEEDCYMCIGELMAGCWSAIEFEREAKAAAELIHFDLPSDLPLETLSVHSREGMTLKAGLLILNGPRWIWRSLVDRSRFL